MKLYCYFLPNKVYKFMDYDYIEELIPIVYKGSVQFLYAFADNKEIAKEFEKERNMDLFRKEIIKIDDDEKEIIDKFLSRHCLAELDYYSIPNDEENVNILMTQLENEIILYGLPFYIFSLLEKYNVLAFSSSLEHDVLNKKYSEAVDYLEFWRIDQMIENDNLEFQDMRGLGWNLVNLFIAIFKELF